MKRFIFKNILLLFFVLVASESVAISDQVLRVSMQDCVNMALRNNEDIKAAHYDVYASIARKIEATKRYVPVVKYRYRFAPVPRDLNDAYGSFFSGDISVLNSIKIEAGVPLSTFGRLSVSKELADIGIDASKLSKIRKADEIVLDIYKLYHGILLAMELEQIAHKGLDAVDKKITELEKAETTDQLQILKLKAIIYQIQKKLDEANTKAVVARAMLKVRMGVEDDTKLVLKDTYLKREYFPYKSYEQLLAISKEKRPEFKLLAHQVNAKAKQIQLERKEYYPKLILGTFFEYGYSPGITGDEDDNDFTNHFNFVRAGIGVELSSDLDFRKIKSKIEFAKAEHLKAIADKRSKHRLLQVDLKNAFLEMLQKKRLLYRAEREQRSARQIVFLTKSNLDIGLGDKKEYLEALQSYLLIQAAVYENIFNYNISVATVKQKVGTLYKRDRLGIY